MTWFDHEFDVIEVTGVLRSRQARAIDFEIEGFAVNARQLGRVADAIGAGRIHVMRGTSFEQAAYVPISNEFIIQAAPPLGRFSRSGDRAILDSALIVHEAVHALRDIERATILPAVDEAIAYVAQAWFMLGHSRAPALADSRRPAYEQSVARILNQAYDIAALGVAGNPPPPAAWSALLEAIRTLVVPGALGISCPYGLTEARVYDGA